MPTKVRGRPLCTDFMVRKILKPPPSLDRLCSAILKRRTLQPDLDPYGLKLHLRRNGFAKTVEGVLSAQFHAAFTRADADAVWQGWVHTREQFQQCRLSLQIKDAERDLAADMTDENWARLQQTLLERKDEDDRATGGGIQ